MDKPHDCLWVQKFSNGELLGGKHLSRSNRLTIFHVVRKPKIPDILHVPVALNLCDHYVWKKVAVEWKKVSVEKGVSGKRCQVRMALDSL